MKSKAIRRCVFPAFLLGAVIGFAQKDPFTTNGKASFYHDMFHGRETSNGEEYSQFDFTAAHRTLPFNTIVRVTNKLNGKSVVVRVNDRGPFRKSRVIDLTRSAAMKLGMIPFGVVPVHIQRLTILDHLPLTDSTMEKNEVWDCFSRKVVLQDSMIFLWQTPSIKHAFYMASDILLSYGVANVYVRAIGEGRHRKYKVLIPRPTGIKEIRQLIQLLKKDGFLAAKEMP